MELKKMPIQGMAKGHSVSIDFYDDIELIIWRPGKYNEAFLIKLGDNDDTLCYEDHDEIRRVIVYNLMRYVDWYRNENTIKKIPSEEDIHITTDKLMNIIKLRTRT